MEKLYTIYDGNKKCTHAEFHEEGSQPVNSTLQLITVEVLPMYDDVNDVIYEGLTELELQEIEFAKIALFQKTVLDKINNLVDELSTRALSSSIGKQGTRSYLESQKAIYLEKYNVAKGITVNTSMGQTITDEMDRDYLTIESLNEVLTSYGITPIGTKLERFYQFIIFRYEYGAQFYGFFISLVEDFRTCALTHCEKGDFDKAELVCIMAQNIPLQVSQQDLLDLRTQMLAI